MINILALELLQLCLVCPGDSLVQVDGSVDGSGDGYHTPPDCLEEQSSDQKTSHRPLAWQRGQGDLGDQTPVIRGDDELVGWSLRSGEVGHDMGLGTPEWYCLFFALPAAMNMLTRHVSQRENLKQRSSWKSQFRWYRTSNASRQGRMLRDT